MSSNEINGAGLPKDTTSVNNNRPQVDREKVEKEKTNGYIRKFYEKKQAIMQEMLKTETKNLAKLEAQLAAEKANLEEQLHNKKSKDGRNIELLKALDEEALIQQMEQEALKELETGVDSLKTQDEKNFIKKLTDETIKELEATNKLEQKPVKKLDPPGYSD